MEGVQLVETRAVVETRTVGAFVDVDIAMTAGPSRFAHASIIANQVGASSRMDARVGSAFVDVDLTIASLEAIETQTGVISHTIDASGAVQTR